MKILLKLIYEIRDEYYVDIKRPKIEKVSIDKIMIIYEGFMKLR